MSESCDIVRPISRENCLSNAKQAALNVVFTSFNLCCKYCNLHFMHSCLFNVFAPFVVKFSIFAVWVRFYYFHWISLHCLQRFKRLLSMISFNLQTWINNTNSSTYPAVGFKIIVSHFFVNMLLFLTDIAFVYQYSIWYHKIRMFK